MTTGTLARPIVITASAAGYTTVRGTSSPSVVISSNIRGGSYLAIDQRWPRLGIAAAAVKISSSIAAAIPDVITSPVVISVAAAGTRTLPQSRMSVIISTYDTLGRTGYRGQTFPGYRDHLTSALPIPISVSATGISGYLRTSTISKSITISASASGHVDLAGILSKSIIITPSISGDADSTGIASIYTSVQISSHGYVVVPTTATLTKPIPITATASGLTRFIRGSLAKNIVIGSTSVGRQPNTGIIGGRINIPPYTPNMITISAGVIRATSYLSPGVPVPTNFRAGTIAREITINCAMAGYLTLDQLGSVQNAPIKIGCSAVGAVRKYTGTINAPIKISLAAFNIDIGVTIPKATVDVVTDQVQFGATVTKLSINPVIEQARDSIIVGKFVAYAVIAPNEEPYQAVLFF